MPDKPKADPSESKTRRVVRVFISSTFRDTIAGAIAMREANLKVRPT